MQVLTVSSNLTYRYSALMHDMQLVCRVWIFKQSRSQHKSHEAMLPVACAIPTCSTARDFLESNAPVLLTLHASRTCPTQQLLFFQWLSSVVVLISVFGVMGALEGGVS